VSEWLVLNRTTAVFKGSRCMARAGRYVRWGYARKVMLSTRPHANAGLRTKGHADARGCQCVTKSRGCEPTLHLELQVSLHGSLPPCCATKQWPYYLAVTSVGVRGSRSELVCALQAVVKGVVVCVPAATTEPLRCVKPWATRGTERTVQNKAPWETIPNECSLGREYRREQ
jgi:hypothetical protein